MVDKNKSLNIIIMKILISVLSSFVFYPAIMLSASDIPYKLLEDISEIKFLLIDNSSEKDFGNNEFKKRLSGLAKDYIKYINPKNAATLMDSKHDLSFLHLAYELEDPETLKKVNALEEWYGCSSYDLPDNLFEVVWGDSVNPKISLQQRREFLKNRPSAGIKSQTAASLQDVHAKDNYLPAWKFWLMAPPSKEREYMRNHITSALYKIGDDSVIPLVIEAMMLESKRDVDSKSKRSATLESINLITSIPGISALEALLECNRFAIENKLNGTDYYDSITRHIIRRLVSRRAYADQLIDPKMKAVIERQGYNEKAEDIPLTDELWKVYKPLIIARLAIANDETPKEDVSLLKAALAIMPVK